MMRITNKLALVTACLAILSAVALKPASAMDNNLSGKLIAQTFNDESFIGEASENGETARKVDDVPPQPDTSDESWIMPVLWGLGGYMIGSLVGTNKTYTKMNKGR
ncbi:hypothetical protein [Rivularia sp. PCC 7116]|uniref:hypothetical protein n=1 Tax=Rivularia sp. PCC 7116 TaxID=373994 RepID=UPI0012F8DC66|nr:hypothetical protein [Rivularia sp. PCC 7116]